MPSLKEMEAQLALPRIQRLQEDEWLAVQNAFSKSVMNTVSSYEELGNPLLEAGENLMVIHTKNIMDDAVVRTVCNARKIGEEQFNLFIKERFIDRGKPVTYQLKKNNLPTLSTPNKKIVSKDKAKVEVLRRTILCSRGCT